MHLSNDVNVSFTTTGGRITAMQIFDKPGDNAYCGQSRTFAISSFLLTYRRGLGYVAYLMVDDVMVKVGWAGSPSNYD